MKATKSIWSEEKVSWGMMKPSMMWKRSVVQASGCGPRVLVALLLLTLVGGGWSAELVIEIPESGAGSAGSYRLNYDPPLGSPPPNHTVPARASTIKFQGRPGTKYHFELYYSNDTFSDLLTWNQTIITAPEPPTNLTVTLGRNKQATVTWQPPAHGNYTGFRFKVVPLTERLEGGARTLPVEGAGNWSLVLRDLAPGATYALHASTLLHDKDSAAYASTNFTTKPNTPGKFIVWFRNETTLLVLWQPPYPPGFYTHYKVSIDPSDARESELYVEKEGEPPGPAQAAFKGLVPGRAYNISVQTVSEPAISAPTTAQYRTVPLRPRNVTLLPGSLTSTSFSVTWLAPLQFSEFEKYQVSVSGGRRLAPVVRARNETARADFDELEPGATYAVTVKTMSGKVTSWPATSDVTLKPLQVSELQWSRGAGAGGDELLLWWTPSANSTQDHYKISYHESAPSRDDSNTLTSSSNNVTLDSLLPGRNYTVTVRAVSRGVEGAERAGWLLTRPLAPALRGATAGAGSLHVAWSADVNSRQHHYELTYQRYHPPNEYPATTLETRETSLWVRELFPGAVYAVWLRAVSHALRSDPAAVRRAVRPLPPLSLTVSRTRSNACSARWTGPGDTSAVGHYVLRYSAADHSAVTITTTDTSAEISNMTHGAQYTITVDSASEEAAGEALESGLPLSALHTVRPNPVSNVAALVDTRNLTLEWPAPAGRQDYYHLTWTAPDSAPQSMNVSAAAGQRWVRAAVDSLQPGAAVSVTIAAVSHGLTSDLFTMDTRTRPLIQSDMTIVTEPENGDDNDTMPSFRVLYTPTPASAAIFDSYRFRLDADGEPPRIVTRAVDAPGQQLSFKQLVPGRLYKLTMWTVSRNVTSHPVERQARLFPRPVTSLAAADVLARSLTLRWLAPRGDYSDFEVQYLNDRDQLVTHPTTDLFYQVTELRPHTLYTFTVETRAGEAAALLTRGRGVSVAVTTKEDVPGAPQSFSPLDAAPAQLSFSWQLPAREQHGELRRFVLRVEREPPLDPPRTIEFPPHARNGTVGGLSPGGTYSFQLWAESGAGRGAAATWRQHMAIAAPPRPAPTALPDQVRRAPTTAAVRFRADFFSSANGNVTAYTLVLGEEPRNDTPARLPAWRDVQGLPLWPPYQVTEPFQPFQQSLAAEFTLGSERCEGSGRVYCNGPLKPNTKYYVKLRAYTAADKFTDTNYAAIYTDADNTAWVAGGSAALLALLAGALAALLLRRRRAPRAAPAPAAPRLSRPVRVADFLDHYRLMSADSDFRFSEEFEELKSVGREQPCAAADLPVNRPKNRFTNILPYDHSRFKLQPVDDEEGSDYINANYVPGHHSPREFLVTQGPLHSTRDDFWRMVWESGAPAVVMLTRCVEKGREKCDRYWPYDTRPAYYGELSVTVLNESRLPDWTVAELLLARGPEQRRLLHFHFTTWPDFGVPEPPTKLARFVRAFRERCGPESRPVVVHCSAGVGRSGTFVALDRALQQLNGRCESLDVFGIVAALRRERAWCVQTEQQYICIHTCLAAALGAGAGAGAEPAPPPPNHHNQAFDDDEGIAESGM